MCVREIERENVCACVCDRERECVYAVDMSECVQRRPALLVHCAVSSVAPRITNEIVTA